MLRWEKAVIIIFITLMSLSLVGVGVAAVAIPTYMTSLYRKFGVERPW